MVKSAVSAATINSVENRKPNTALLEAKRKAKLLRMQQQNQQDTAVKDIFQNVSYLISRLEIILSIFYFDTIPFICRL